MCFAAAVPAAAAIGGAGGAAAGGMSLATMAQIAGVAMSGLSMLANQSAQKQVINKRNAVATDEAARQRALQSRADEVNRAQESNFTRPAQDASLSDQFTRRNSFIQDNMPTLSESLPVGDGAPTVVKGDLAKRVADALSYGRNLATSQAKLGAYGSNQFNNSISLGRSGQTLGQIGDSSGRSSAIAGSELEAANGAGNGTRSLADAFRLGGQGSLLWGMTRPTAPLVKEMVPGQHSLSNPAYG